MRLQQIDNKKLYKVSLNNCTIWFSYETPIAIYTDELYVTNEYYSSTTSRHKNIIDPYKDSRIDESLFNNLLIGVM